MCRLTFSLPGWGTLVCNAAMLEHTTSFAARACRLSWLLPCTTVTRLTQGPARPLWPGSVVCQQPAESVWPGLIWMAWPTIAQGRQSKTRPHKPVITVNDIGELPPTWPIRRPDVSAWSASASTSHLRHGMISKHRARLTFKGLDGAMTDCSSTWWPTSW